ncbi:hypothetical protein BRARA_E00086 [Brassica rapa]|uniref:Uncharacterized protein n=1 Tax=Brassica campestris TaxID=3711 RepID=A0A397Z7G0_BRACM|nr:hypothetical protein BRARA_E00086 [Brassica rapa]
MASESGLNGDANIVEEVSETKRSRDEEEKEDKEVKKNNNEDHEKTKTVPFYKLFAFADSFDFLLMTLGTLGSIGNGLGFPIMTILFGDLVDAFGENQNDSNVADKVSKVSLKFVWLGIGTFAAAFLQLSGWMISGERQAARIRSMYLKTILRQDIAFFDVDTNTGEVVGRMSGDTVLIQDAMGEKVGKAIQLLATFVGGFVIAFIRGWLLTLVMLSSIPLLVMAGAGLAIVITRTASRGQTAYAKAAVVVEQTIGSIRTVASFTGEKQAISNYNKHLVTAYKAGVIEGGSTGLGLGTLFLVVFCSYALAVWYGGKLILDKGYTGGQVLNIIISVLTGSMSLGQASPCLTAFAAGQAAAYKMFETIERRPDIDSYSTDGKVLDDIKGDIELKDVYFTYPARPDEQIFRGFSLFISSGTTVALVGQSGSGKSTVVSLIERFYDPQAGEVIIDGVNLKEFQLKWIRSKIGLVSQEPLRHVSFKYPSRPDVQIFQDLCLSIRAGKTVALVGESGSGKSTVIALLQRFYDPDSGEITLDGVEIKTLRLKWLRQQTGLVSQEPILFNETIRANIAYGKGGDASESEIVSAAELSNAHGFISGLQQGYDTMVGERGIQLSGGQKQRVAIARAIVKDPKVLLLDEATSALDAESERVVQDALDRVMVNRTTIVVAHRLSTIKNADVIAVVKNGVIVEKGKHESLINIKDGVYASLVQLHLSAAS